MPIDPESAAGLCFATETTGMRLPVIDVTHPVFAVRHSESELQTMLEAHRALERRRATQPRWLQKVFLRFFLRRSELIRRLRRASGSFLDGMSTYRLKLGSRALDPSWAAPIDRKIADSLPCLSLRLRLQDMADLLAADLAPRLLRRSGLPLHLVNIAGGPSMDSLNALILLQKKDPGLLREREVRIHLFDQDRMGPAFAIDALEALKRPGAPLAGLNIILTHLSYRWDDTRILRDDLSRLPSEMIAAASSEGGLFDYGSDDDIVANLEVLRTSLPADAVVAGSLTPPKSPDKSSALRLNLTTRERDVTSLDRLVARAQWHVDRSLQRPFHFSVLLRRTAAAPLN